MLIIILNMIRYLSHFRSPGLSINYNIRKQFLNFYMPKFGYLTNTYTFVLYLLPKPLQYSTFIKIINYFHVLQIFFCSSWTIIVINETRESIQRVGIYSWKSTGFNRRPILVQVFCRTGKGSHGQCHSHPSCC